jgi:uncharacterized membrane protein
MVNIEDVLIAFSTFLENARSAKEPEQILLLQEHLKVLRLFCERNNLHIDFKSKPAQVKNEPSIFRADINDKWL